MTGASLQTIVLLPGMDGTGELFSLFVAALSPGVEVLIVRYPNQKPQSYSELLAVVRNALPVDRPYTLLAESFSGPLGIQIAAEAPVCFQKLVLCCTFAKNPRPSLSLIRHLLPLLPMSAMPLPVLGRVLMDTQWDAGLQATLSEAMAQVSANVLRARAQAVLNVDVLADLRKIAAPTLYLRASDDRVVPKQASELMLTHKPDIEIADLVGPHFLLQTRAVEAARVVQDFLKA